MSRLRHYASTLLENNVFARTYRSALAFIYHRARVHPRTEFRIDGVFQLGRGAGIQQGCRIECGPSGTLMLGDGAWLGRNVLVQASDVSIGVGATIQDNCRVIGEVTIGRGCIVAPNVFLSSGRHHFNVIPHLTIREQDRKVHLDPKYKALLSQPIIIEDDCWIGINVVISPGVTIHRGSVVGANSVVTADVAPFTIVGGVPAKLVGKRGTSSPGG